MIRRRVILVSSLAIIVPPAIATAPSQAATEWHWIYGEWRSDVKMTMENYTFQKKRPTPENLAKIATIFGIMTHEIIPGNLIVTSSFNEMKHRETYKFRVSRYTSSTVTLEFYGKDAPPEMTMYKGNGLYMVRVGDNFEYFKKVA